MEFPSLSQSDDAELGNSLGSNHTDGGVDPEEARADDHEGGHGEQEKFAAGHLPGRCRARAERAGGPDPESGTEREEERTAEKKDVLLPQQLRAAAEVHC